MESKNIKVVDEHSIDRNASIICSIDVDGSDYVVYSIERDAENDNVFVSKLLKNIDGTSSMINIEDSMEKSKIADVVKELIKLSIDNEANTMEGKSVTLSNGKVVGVSSVLINKEQYINVQKTYITTVKKSVTKVTGDYYNVKESNVSVAPSVVDIFPTEMPAAPEVSVVPPVVEPVAPTPVIAPVVPEVAPSVVEPEIQAVNLTIPNVVASDVVVPVAPVVSEPTPAPVTEPVVPTPVVPVVEQVSVVEAVPTEVTPVVPTVEVPEVAPVSVVPPVVESTPVVEPVAEPVMSTHDTNQLIFDASKESNLNMALGEASNESKISAEDVSSIREFGEDVVKTAPVVSEESVASTESVPVAPNGQSGFANNKFFMFIAIAFFLASCIFLGYEVYHYFQLAK